MPPKYSETNQLALEAIKSAVARARTRGLGITRRTYFLRPYNGPMTACCPLGAVILDNPVFDFPFGTNNLSKAMRILGVSRQFAHAFVRELDGLSTVEPLTVDVLQGQSAAREVLAWLRAEGVDFPEDGTH